MAPKGTSTLTKLRFIPYWTIALSLLIVAIAGMLLMVWLSGASETKRAMETGSRLLLILESGDIQGKYTPDPDAPAPAAVAAATPDAATPADANPDAPADKPKAEAPIPGANALAGPNPALTGKTASGTVVPIIGADGTKPWRYYGRPFERTDNSLPMIAIIITGLGEAKSVTDSAIKLSPNFSLSFTPYAHDIETWNLSARASGHETLIDMPMEPSNFPAADPGPYALMSDKDPKENEKRFEWMLSRVPGYVGLLTPQDEVFSGNKEVFKSILGAVENHGLMLAVGREPAKNDIKDMVESGNTAAVIGNVLIDEELTSTAIQSRLTSLEQIAKKRGYAVGIAQPFPLTMEELRLWSEQLAARGFILVPVTAIVHLRFS